MIPVGLGAIWAGGIGILGILAIFLWVLALSDLIGKRSDLDRGQRSGWILLVVLLPIIGSLWYLFQRPMLEDERKKTLRDASRRHSR